MTDALARPRPRIDHPDELERLVRQIVERVDPVAVYLFGSRARGDVDENSDYDLMVVVRDEVSLDHPFRDRLWQTARAARIGATPFVTRRASFAWRRSESGRSNTRSRPTASNSTRSATASSHSCPEDDEA